MREKFTDVGLVKASTLDNRALPPVYVARLREALSEKAALAYIDGQFVSLSSGLVYYGFDKMENVVDLKEPRGAVYGAGMDFNVNPMAATVYWRHDDHVHYVHEVELPNSDTEEMCGYLKDHYWRKGLREIYPDPTGKRRSSNSPGGKSDFHYIEQAGFRVIAKSRSPLRRDRYNAVNGKLKPRNKQLSLTISPKCKKLVKYLSTYSHETLNQQERLSHLLDAFSYPIDYQFSLTREDLKLVKVSGTY